MRTTEPIMDATHLSDRWWMLTLRGVAGVIFGILTFISPQSSLVALVLLFGAYALVNGAINLAMAVRRPPDGRRWTALLVESIVGIAAGVLTLVWPGITAIALLAVIAVWAIVTGVAQVVAAVRLRRTIRGEWLLALSGVFSVALGVLLLLAPVAGALALVLWIGAYALVFGALLIALSLRLRTFGRTPRTGFPAEPSPSRA